MNPHAMTEPSPTVARSPIVAVEVVALGLTIACGLAAWGASLQTCGYDYDEVTRAHSIWLASTGLRPYNDFFECHPPYFRLLVPLVQGQANPLFTLRVFAAVGNLLFLGGLGLLGAALVPAGRRWAWLGLAVVAFHPSVLHFLVEFRIDGWGYALATWSIYRHHRLVSGAYRDFELGVLTGVATLWFCPKLTVLPAAVVLVGQFRAWKSVRPAAWSVGAYGAGVGVAVGLFFAFLAWQGIDLGRMFQLLVRYHAVSGANASFHRGLLQSLAADRLMMGLIALGVVGWGLAWGRGRVWPGAYEVALFAWLAAQAVLVAYPYKQYYAPWFLFASGYLGFLGQGSSVWLRRVRLIPFLAACGFTCLGAFQVAQAWSNFNEAQSQAELFRWMDQVVGPEDWVVAAPPLHPINRRDTFFIWFNTADPGGFDSEQILARLPTYRPKVAPGRFLEELEAHPPALILLSAGSRSVPYTKGQLDALNKFLPRRGYRMVQVGEAWVALRPARLDPPAASPPQRWAVP